jgi:hypothetical protein
MDQCAECGFEYDLDAATSAGGDIVVGAAQLATMLHDDRGDLRRHVRPETWSPLEYGCHVRDVLLVQRERVLAARRVDRPTFEPMGRDERAEHDGYAHQDPEAVARQLTDAATMFANVLAQLDPEDWGRVVVYGYPARLERSLRWVAVHTVHEVRHHLLDVRRQLAAGADGA